MATFYSEERRTKFIGRIQEQRQFRVAMAGLLDHHRRWRDMVRGARIDLDQTLDDDSYTRIFLPHGIGGIGKSWLTRRCLTLAQEADSAPPILTLYDDVSLGAPVLEPADLMGRLYEQLIEAGHAADVASYQQAKADLPQITDRVNRYRLENRERWEALLKSAATFILPGTTVSPSGKVEPGRQSQDAAILANTNDLLLEEMQQADQLAPDQAYLFRNPAAVQAAHLVTGLKKIVRQRPIVIALDNLEIVVPLEAFIRDYLVLPTIHMPLFWILSGRYNLADERVVQIDGKKHVHKGYRDLLGENPPLVWDMSSFGDADLQEYLEAEAQRRQRVLAVDQGLIAAVKATSSGVPLVVEMVADALFTLDRNEFLQNFILDDQSLLPAGRLEQITARFLRYCLTREDDLTRVQGLALLRKGAGEAAIQAVWDLMPEFTVADMLHDMGMRYAFVQAEGLHDAVYEFVRRQLHTLTADNPVRAQLSRRALTHYQAIWDELQVATADPAPRTRDAAWQDATRDLLNAWLWIDPNQAIRFFLPRFVEGLGFARPLAEELLHQVEESLAQDRTGMQPDQANLLAQLQAGLQDTGWYFDEPGQAIGRMALTLLNEPGLTDLHLSILHLWQGGWLVGEQHYDDALAAYSRAEHHLPAPAFDLRKQLGRAFYQLSGRFLWPERAAETAPSEPGLQAAQHAVALDPDNGDAWYNLGLALEALERPAEAVPAFHRAIALEPRPVHYNSLGDVYSLLDIEDEAMEAYQRAIELDPHYAWPYHGLGLIFSERGDYERAISYYRHALERHAHDRDRAVSWEGLGDIYNAVGRFDEAIEAYREGIKLNPSDALLWYSLGNTYSAGRRTGRDDDQKAIEAYRRAIELDPSYAWSYHRLGLVYARHEQYSPAMILFQQALERHQDDQGRAASWNSLGMVYTALGRSEEALAAYQQALALDDTYAPVWNSLGEVYNSQGRFAKAVEALERSIELDPQQPLPWTNLGNAYGALDQLDDAIEAYHQAIELDPDNAWPYNNLGFVYQKLGRPERAVEVYQQAIERHDDGPDKAVSWDNLGNAYRALDNPEAAISAYRWASTLAPDYPWPYHNQGLVYSEQGKYEQAVALFQQAIERHKNDLHQAASWSRLGDVYQALKRLQEAIVAYERVIELNPADALPWYNLGNIYRAQKRYGNVIDAYRRAIELDPTNARPYFNLGLTYEEQGEYEAALRCFKQATERYKDESDRAVAWNKVGDVYRAQAEFEQAEEAYDQAVEFDPDYAWSYHNLGLIYSEPDPETGEPDYDVALGLFQQAIERHEDDRGSAQSWNKLGDTYRALNRFKESIAAYERAIELDPQYAPSWNDLGDVYRTLDRLEEATQAYQHAIESNPNYAWPYHNLGLIYEEREQHKLAATYFQQAIERHTADPDRARAWNCLGDTYQALRQQGEALEAYQQSIRLDPAFVPPLNSLGQIYHAQNRPEEAIAIFEQAIDLDPEAARPRNSLGDVYRSQKRYEQAEAAYEKARELDPAYAWPYHNLGLISEERGQYQQALSFYQQASERHKDTHHQAVVWSHIGDVTMALPRYSDADQAYRQAMAMDPDYAWPYHNLGFLYERLGDYEAAIPYYQQAVERHTSAQDRVASLNNLASANRTLGRYQAAIDAYQQVTKLAPDLARPWNNLGTAYTTLERYDAAIEAFKRAVELDPSYAWAYHNLGFVYEKQSKYEAAIPQYKQAIARHEHDADSAVTWNNLGNIYDALGRSEEAIKAYHQAIEVDATYALPWDSLGDVYRRSERYEEAIEAYERAIKLAPTYAWPYNNLALIYKTQDKPEAAIPLYRQAIERHQTDQDRAISWNNLGSAYRAMGHFEDAVEAHQQATALDPTYAWAYNNLGVAYAEQGAYEDAIAAYRQATQRHRNQKNKALAWDNMGKAYAGLEQYDEAVKAHRQAVALDGENAVPWTNLGNAYLELHQYRQAIDAYHQAIKLDQSYALPWNGLGDVYRAMKQPDKAIQAYERAIQTDPAYAWPYRNLAPIFEERGAYEQAIDFYQKAISRQENDEQRAIWWYSVGNIHRLLDQHEAAINAYRQAIASDQAYAPAWFNMGNESAALGRPEAATEAFTRAIELAPNNAWAYHNLGQVKEKLESFDEATDLYHEAIARHRTNQDRATTWYSLGNVYGKQWLYAEATVAYRQAIALDPTFALPWSSLGDVFGALERQVEAIQAYLRAIELDPTYAPAYNNLGFVYEQLGQHDQAIETYQQVAQQTDSRLEKAVAWNNLGNVYRTLDRTKEAIKAYQEAIKLDPDYTWPYHNLGAIYEKQGHNEKALALYERATRRRKRQGSPEAE